MDDDIQKQLVANLTTRMEEARATDIETGEHPDATPSDYLEWALEEACENDGYIITKAPACPHGYGHAHNCATCAPSNN